MDMKSGNKERDALTVALQLLGWAFILLYIALIAFGSSFESLFAFRIGFVYVWQIVLPVFTFAMVASATRSHTWLVIWVSIVCMIVDIVYAAFLIYRIIICMNDSDCDEKKDEFIWVIIFSLCVVIVIIIILWLSIVFMRKYAPSIDEDDPYTDLDEEYNSSDSPFVGSDIRLN